MGFLSNLFKSYDDWGFDQNGIHRDTGTKYDRYGYDKNGRNREGFDREGYDWQGYNKEGYDRQGYDHKGFNKEGYDKYGRNREGFDREGYDWQGYNKEGYDKRGFDRTGFNREGYDRQGYDKYGRDREGYDRGGYDRNGFDKNGINIITKTKYDVNGYDVNGNRSTQIISNQSNKTLIKNKEEKVEEEKVEEEKVEEEKVEEEKVEEEKVEEEKVENNNSGKTNNLVHHGMRFKFDGLMVTLASMEDVANWSHGVVDNPDTINYRTGKPKQSGLFCESIFGPIHNFECGCGKYKGLRYKGIVCERCGVEVTSSAVRRTRMGHIDLASPVVHVWYKNSIHQLLQLSTNEIDKILTFEKYVVVKEIDEEVKFQIQKKILADFDATMKELNGLYKDEIDRVTDKRLLAEAKKLYNENKASLEAEIQRIRGLVADLKFGATILESDYRNIFSQFSKRISFASGPEGILKMLQAIDVEKEIKRRVKEYPTLKSIEQKGKAMSLIKLLINLYVSGVKPENMIIRKLPVIPPDTRPVIQLDGGRFASSDINLFYRRVLMRNIRLKKMIQVGMPDIVKKNEARLLQISVDNLFIGERNSAALAGEGTKIFRPLSEMLSGKEGVFRRNLLGKRVDYSGRSVITVGPDLKLTQCGLPIWMATKMFTPFIIGKLIEKRIVYTPKQAEKLIKDENPIALKFLEEVVKDKYVLLNRAPTLHRLSIQAFRIKLVPGKTIRLHPLVCAALNADFDGDEIAVHIPMSDEAQKEARELMASEKNIIKPGDGEIILSLGHDIALGIYYLTDYYNKSRPDIISEEDWNNKILPVARFASIDDAVNAFYSDHISIKDKIVVIHNGEVLETTIGRVIFNKILPKDYPFINRKLGNKDLKRLLSEIFDKYGMETTAQIADAIKDCGIKYSTFAATSINVLDMKVPYKKEDIIKSGEDMTNHVLDYSHKGLLSEEEKHKLIIDIWTNVKKDIEKELNTVIKPGNDLFTLIDSGARGSQTHLTQICGMKGLVVNPQGEIIELPIKSSFVEGLKPIEYFNSAHSGRKGKADTALRAAESGYLTRKLCDASQEMIVREEDCGTEESVIYSRDEAEIKGEKFSSLIYGRILAEDAEDENHNVVLKAGEMITKSALSLLESSNVSMVRVRSPLTCHCASGVCQKCYGMDISTRHFVDIGAPIGVIAAQSIGELSMQLTFDTGHTGGVAEEAGTCFLIDRIKQLLEIRSPRNPAIVAPFDGTLSFEETLEGEKFGKMIIKPSNQNQRYNIIEGYDTIVGIGDILQKGSVYAKNGASKLIIKEPGEVIEVNNDFIILSTNKVYSRSLYGLLPKKTRSGSKVYRGEILTTGALDINEYLRTVGDIQAQRYIVSEIKKVFNSQGQIINDKHLEVIAKQLFSKVFIEDGGDSSFIPGSFVKYEDFIKGNEKLQSKGKRQAQGQRVALGLTTIAKETDSWLSAASFQEMIRVMVNASLRGAIDDLSDLKANVIIGRLLPVGENYRNIHGY